MPDGLLDTYHAERHPVGTSVLRNTMAQVALLRTDDRTEALRDVVVSARPSMVKRAISKH
ncbi:MAG TPA: hypothetical protein VFP88_08795 [Rhodanobacteraceae bacterium]|nr:hypothetical protein [Rhodanobacteraceae bacterium]